MPAPDPRSPGPLAALAGTWVDVARLGRPQAHSGRNTLRRVAG